MFLESSFPLWFQRFLWRVSTKTDRSELRNVTRNITSQLSRIFYDLLCVMTNWFCNLKKVILDWKELQPIVTKQILPDSSTINSWLVTHVSRPTLPQVWGGGWLPILLPPGVPNLSALINHTFGTHDSDEFTVPNLEKNSGRFAAVETFKIIKILGKSKGGSLWTSELGLVTRT